jgi:hypothetical protein
MQAFGAMNFFSLTMANGISYIDAMFTHPQLSAFLLSLASLSLATPLLARA